MRRASILALAPIAVVACITIVLTLLPARISARHDAVARYITYRQQHSGPSLRITLELKAQRPERLLPPVDATTFGSGIYYRADHSTVAEEIATHGAVSDGTVLLQPDVPDGLRPVPYPPQEVWCVWLEEVDDASSAEQLLVLAARHMDLYNAAWIIHEPTTSPATLYQVVDDVGCKNSK